MVVLVVEEVVREVDLVDQLGEEVDLEPEEELGEEEALVHPEVGLQPGVERQGVGVDLVVDEYHTAQIHIRVFFTRDMHLLYNSNFYFLLSTDLLLFFYFVH